MKLRPFDYPRAFVTSAAMKVLTHGNSFMAAGWPTTMMGLAPLAGKGITLVNAGVGGQTIVTERPSFIGKMMQTTGPAAIDAVLDAGKINVLIAAEFTNELLANNYDGAAAHTAWKAYCLARRAAATSAGKTLFIISCTTVPVGDAVATQPEVDSRMVQYTLTNTLMRARYREYADLLLDIANVEPFKTMYRNAVYTPAVFTATGVYNADLLHMNTAGYGIWAREGARAVARARQ